MRSIPLGQLVPFLAGMLEVTKAVRCFCTEDHCTYGVCDSPWCLVGIKESGQVIRTCGSEAARMLELCRKNVGEWEEVCACSTPYCNTFAYLRHQIKNNRFAPVHTKDSSPQLPSNFEEFRIFKSREVSHRKSPTAYKSTLDSFARDNSDHYDAYDDSEDETIFTVQNGQSSRNEPSVFTLNSRTDSDFHLSDLDQRRKKTQVSYLIVVLIIVPLVVGGSAVFLVAANYYCSLC